MVAKVRVTNRAKLGSSSTGKEGFTRRAVATTDS